MNIAQGLGLRVLLTDLGAQDGFEQIDTETLAVFFSFSAVSALPRVQLQPVAV